MPAGSDAGARSWLRGPTFIPEMMTSSAVFTMFLKKPPNISLAFFLRTVSYTEKKGIFIIMMLNLNKILLSRLDHCTYH
jgi:hypothetical protein